jgi:hypothetical protein
MGRPRTGHSLMQASRRVVLDSAACRRTAQCVSNDCGKEFTEISPSSFGISLYRIAV